MRDASGLTLAVVIAGSYTHDTKLVADTLDALQTVRPGRMYHLCIDKGYEVGWLKAYLKNIRYESHPFSERWLSEYNNECPHESLNNMTPEE